VREVLQGIDRKEGEKDRERGREGGREGKREGGRETVEGKRRKREIARHMGGREKKQQQSKQCSNRLVGKLCVGGGM
jgi:hypothetical protein